MTTPNSSTVFDPPDKPIQIDLRDPWLAAFLAWLIPGLGHLYQRRWGKGGLFMVCILGTFFYGLWIGGGRVVYASFREPEFRDWRWAYVAQVSAGLPALPAVVQAIRTGQPNPKAPLFGGFMAPPMSRGQLVPSSWVIQQNKLERDTGTTPAEYDFAYFSNYRDPPPPYLFYNGGQTDQSGQWNFKYGGYFDLGTVFTVIAGLLNVLAIWDAWGGPMVIAPKPKSEKTKRRSDEPDKDGKAPEAEAADPQEGDEPIKGKTS